MTLMMTALLGLTLGTPSLQDDDTEAKKKRLGELVQQMNKLQGEVQKLIDELTGGDQSKQSDLMMEVIKKYAPEMENMVLRSSKAANERNAAMRSIVEARRDGEAAQ